MAGFILKLSHSLREAPLAHQDSEHRFSTPFRAAVDGGEPVLSEEFIAVVVPDAPSGEVLVVASRPGQASEILSRPSAPAETMALALKR